MNALSGKTIHAILQQDPQSILGFIQKKVSELKKINTIWQAEIETDLAEQCCVANFRDDILIIEINNAAWATRLRYLIPDLIKKLQKYPDLQSLKRINCYIQPNRATKKQNPALLTLSEKSAQLLKNTAKNIKVKSLQEALIQLSER